MQVIRRKGLHNHLLLHVVAQATTRSPTSHAFVFDEDDLLGARTESWSTFHVLFRRSEVELGTSDSGMTGRHWHWPEVVELATASPSAGNGGINRTQTKIYEGRDLCHVLEFGSYEEHLS